MSNENLESIRAIARDVDVMGGIGHESMLSGDALTRRRAARALVACCDAIVQLSAVSESRHEVAQNLVLAAASGDFPRPIETDAAQAAEGRWHVDDGMGVEFFGTRAESLAYAREVALRTLEERIAEADARNGLTDD